MKKIFNILWWGTNNPQKILKFKIEKHTNGLYESIHTDLMVMEARLLTEPENELLCARHRKTVKLYNHLKAALIISLKTKKNIMKKMIYAVYFASGGNVYSGYKSKFVSNHLDKELADKMAQINSGWVEEREEDMHPDFIKALEVEDNKLREQHRMINMQLLGKSVPL